MGPTGQRPAEVSRLRLGFACNWDPDPRLTRSGVPWRLRSALAEQADVVDVGLRLTGAPRVLLKAAYARRGEGRWVSVWKYSDLFGAVARRAIAREVRRQHPEAVAMIEDLAPVDETPFFLVQDLSFDVLLRHHADNGVPGFPGLDLDLLKSRRDRQRRIYERAAGIFARTRWFARTLVEWSGVPEHKIRVMYPGSNAPPPDPAALEARLMRRRRRLLFVGKDFERKGGDLVVAALARLRRDFDPETALTVAGPREWPMPGGVPAGVTFLGPVSLAEVGRLLDAHDLFVLPSRFEAFGIAFADAVSHGLPCVARDAFAMPEVVVPGQTGELVTDDDPDALAEVVARALDDDALFANCRARQPEMAAQFSWTRAAGDLVAGIEETIR